MGTYINWLIVAKRLRLYSEHIKANTIPDYLSNRFHDKGGLLIGMSAIIIIVFFVPYVASGFAGVGKLFNSLFGIDYHLVMVVGAVIIATYTLLGGFLAASTTDFIQSIIMTLALVVVMGYGITRAGGMDQVMENTKDVANYFSLTAPDGSYSALPIVSTMAWGLGYFGMPHIIIRFMSIEKPSMVKQSAVIAIVWVVLAIGAACLMAYQARMIVGEELLTVGAQKTVFIVMARRFFPPLISGFLLAAIMAASVSTADSQLLVASSSFTADMYQPIVRPEASAKEVLMVGRIAVIIIAIIAYLIASSKGAGAQAIMNLVENAWGLFGAAFGPVILLSLFWRRFNYAGACTGVIIGAAVDIIWLLCCSGTGVYEIVPGFICGGIAAIIVTKISPEPSKEVTDIFDNAIAEGESE